jgi:hypothetical protein
VFFSVAKVFLIIPLSDFTIPSSTLYKNYLSNSSLAAPSTLARSRNSVKLVFLQPCGCDKKAISVPAEVRENAYTRSRTIPYAAFEREFRR